MKFERKKIVLALACALGGTALLAGTAALAQQRDRIEVTGSSIKRLADEQSLPVTTLNVSELQKAGVINAEQAVQFITANASSTTTTTSVGASNGGAANADLRGLGEERTLVLVNGKRMVNNPYLSAAVDLNALPFGAIDRIEVLTDGASAIYGSDAIAGVINFITRKEYAGFGATGSLSMPTSKGDGKQTTGGITLGTGELAKDGWNIFAGLSFSRQDPLAATSRDYAKTSYIPAVGYDKTSPTTFPGNYFQGVLPSTNPSLPNCDPPFSLHIGSICRFDYVPFINIIPEQKQASFIARASWAVNKDNTLAAEYIQANNKVKSVISPTPVTGLSVPSTNPFFPGKGLTAPSPNPAFDPTVPVVAGWRQTELGGRASQIENDTNRILVNWDGQYKGWDYSVTALRSHADVTNTFTGGYVNKSRLDDGMAGVNGAPFLNPFGAQTAAGSVYLGSSRVLGQVQQAEGTLNDLTMNLSGEIWKLQAGSVLLAVGAEFFKDKANYTNNFTLIRQAVSSGLELAEDSEGQRKDNAVYGELNIPILKSLELNLAGRYDHYSDFGGTFNPKISMKWQPTKEVLVRGSYNEGFRAPTLQDVYAPTSFTNTGQPYDDPLLCPGGVVNPALGGVEARDCQIQFNQQQGGNRNLKPETSKAYSFGGAWQPVPSTTVGADYWNYKVSDSIGPTGEDVIFGSPDRYSQQFVRCGTLSPAEAAAFDECDPGNSPNTLAYIINTQLNLGNYKTSGIDFNASWQGEATPYGRFNVGYRSTWVLVYKYQLEKGAVYNDNLGIYFNGQPVAKYRQIMNFGWNYGAWSSQLVWRYTSGYKDQYDENSDTVDPPRKVSANSVWDLAVTWAAVPGFNLTAGLTNVFDKKPPFSNQDGGFQVGYDYRYASPLGRAILLRASYQY